ncbi:ATP-binding protein [Aliihoeflea sp. PC F10.4]
MYVERTGAQGDAVSQERRDALQPDSRVLGRVVQCDGARATIAATADGAQSASDGLWAVGRMITINLGAARTVGLVYAIETPHGAWKNDADNALIVRVELVGEVRDVASKPTFDRGITIYPHVGAIAHRIRSRDLEAVYDLAGRAAVSVGRLSQDEQIFARIAMDTTLSRHFAVLGTTGVGKSSAVALLLRKAIEANPDLRVLILDPHNEFHSAFPQQSIRIDTNSLDMPFWLFRLEELYEVLFRGREPVAEEVDLLRDMIPMAKNRYNRPSGSAALLRRGVDATSVTADTPVPYRMIDLLKLIDERTGLLESKAERPHCRALRARIESALADPRYRFMFASRLIEDTLHEAIGKIFRIPHHGKTITCFELAGLPSEVVNSVCSVLSRLAFDLAAGSQGKLKLLVLCEEAHRYMPADHRLGFAPTRHALSRIAKEGRKYGAYLGVVTQRPGELDPTVLSQCSTIFAMRLANERDQDIIRSAIADSSASTLAFLSSMGQREAIAFGEGVATTMRMKFETLKPDELPGRAVDTNAIDTAKGELDLHALVRGLRGDVPVFAADDFPDKIGDDPFERLAAALDAPPPALPRSGTRRFPEDMSLRRLYED